MSDKSKRNIKLTLLFISIVIITIGIMILLTAAELAPVFKGLYNINNVLGRYIIVILTMATGIMLFSNISTTIKDKKLRNSLTIAITVFSTILTIPLLYVFIAIFFAEKGIIGPIGEIMMIEKIIQGFKSWFGNGNIIYVIYVFMLILSIIFITVPLLTGILTLKGKALKVGRQSSGKLGIGMIELPIITKIKEMD